MDDQDEPRTEPVTASDDSGTGSDAPQVITCGGGLSLPQIGAGNRG
jgi:hypothetical protein